MIINITVLYTDRNGHEITTYEAASLARPFYTRHGGLPMDTDPRGVQFALRRIQSGHSINQILAKLTAWAYRTYDTEIID